MRVELIEDLEPVAGDWAALTRADPLATPFLAIEWLSIWLRYWSEGGRPWVLVAYDGQRLAGILPLQRASRRGLRFLTGLGVGFGDYWDILTSVGDRAAVTSALAAELARHSGEWDALVIDKLPEDSATPAALRQAGLRVGPATRLPSPRIDLPGSFDDYLAGLSKSRRFRLRRNLKVFDEGPLSVREITDPEEVPEVLERWQQLRVQWWEQREREMMGEHSSERFLAFTTEVVLALLPLGQALVWEVFADGRPVGVTVNFLDEQAFYYWLWGFDASVQDLRPGHALIGHGIRWSIETGRRYFDFMLGGESYKYDYAPVDRGVLTMIVGSTRLRSRATLGLEPAPLAASPWPRRCSHRRAGDLRRGTGRTPGTVLSMRVAVLNDLSGLGEQWSSLHSSDPTATPFASLQWLTAWIRHWSEGGEPWILAAYEDERLVGAAPFLRRRRGGLRLLNGLGVGVGNYWDVIAAPGERERVVSAFAEALVSRSREWDLFFLDKLPEESSTLAALRRAGLRVQATGETVSPRIELPASLDEYLSRLSGKSRRDVRRALGRFDDGQLHVREFSDPDELRSAVARWQELKVEWWTRRRQPMNPEHASERFREFTIDALCGMVPRGLATVWEVSDGEQTIAISIGLLDRSSFYGWLFAFDSRYENLRPGHMIVSYAIRWTLERGLPYFDFMLGSESYKYHYAPRDRTVLTATVANGGLRSRVAGGISRLKQAVRPPERMVSAAPGSQQAPSAEGRDAAVKEPQRVASSA